MDIATLLEVLVKGLNEAEEEFFENPKDFFSLETSVKSTTEAFAAEYLGMVLSSINHKIITKETFFKLIEVRKMFSFLVNFVKKISIIDF